MQVLEPLIFSSHTAAAADERHQLAAKRGDAKFIWVGELKTNFLFLALPPFLLPLAMLLGQDKQKNLFIQKREKRIQNSSGSSSSPFFHSPAAFIKPFPWPNTNSNEVQRLLFNQMFLFCVLQVLSHSQNQEESQGIMALASGNCM